EFQDFLETTLQLRDELYILGDFNIHVDLPNINTRLFMDALQTFDLQQHVSFATHIHGHWLDLFITRSNCNNIKAVFVTDGLSDHHTVIIDLCLKVESGPKTQCITFRPIHKIKINNLCEDLENSDLLIKPKTT
ncbi:MAG: hypothetical protein M3H12_00015, partial [Chromatiales bacterium]